MSPPGVVPYGSAMGQPPSQLPTPAEDPRRASVRRVGKVSQYVGGRLLMVGLIAGVVGLGLLVFAGIRLWLVVTRGKLSPDIVPMVVAGMVAFALLSISASARKTGLRYIRGDRAVSSDLMRYFVRRMERRRQARGR